MKEEAWSIRKMRKLQELSTTKNTYKRDNGDQPKVDLEQEVNMSKEGFLDRVYNKLSLFLEE